MSLCIAFLRSTWTREGRGGGGEGWGEKKEAHKKQGAGVRGSVSSGEAGIHGDITGADGGGALNNGCTERRKSVCEGKEEMEPEDQEAPGAGVYTPASHVT